MRRGSSGFWELYLMKGKHKVCARVCQTLPLCQDMSFILWVLSFLTMTFGVPAVSAGGMQCELLFVVLHL